MSARVICLSRAIRSGADEVAALVGKELGFRCVDEEVIARAAELRQVDPAAVADAEKRKSFLERVFEDIGVGGGMSGYGTGHIPDPGVLPPRSDELRALIRSAIEEIAEEGKVVIVAHAASYALGKRGDVLRALVTGSLAVRAGRLAAAEGKSAQEAAQAVRQSDASRADYLKRFYQVDRELPEHYDLCVSTDVMTVEHAATQIVAAARAIHG
ncbi:MAG: cytidylate kinase-like family protein [Ramlibacter sp.]